MAFVEQSHSFIGHGTGPRDGPSSLLRKVLASSALHHLKEGYPFTASRANTNTIGVKGDARWG